MGSPMSQRAPVRRTGLGFGDVNIFVLIMTSSLFAPLWQHRVVFDRRSHLASSPLCAVGYFGTELVLSFNIEDSGVSLCL